jgi:DNA-binding transcriptional LysR family regulator
MIYPNPRHLRAFVAVADAGSFSLAAEAVHLGQPALSQAIAKLEGVVGVRLVERTTRSVRLTPAGAEFLVEARRVLEAYERMMLRGSEWAHLRRGRIALLTVPSMAHRLLPSLVRAFTALHEGVSIELHDHADPVLRQRLERGEGDLAILSQSSAQPSPGMLPFLKDRLRVVLPRGHALAARQVVEAAQLAGERLILLRRGAIFRSYMDAAISGLPLAQEPIEVDQSGAAVGRHQAARAARGVAHHRLRIAAGPRAHACRPGLRAQRLRRPGGQPGQAAGGLRAAGGQPAAHPQVPGGAGRHAQRPRRVGTQGVTSSVTGMEVTAPAWLNTVTVYVPASAAVTGGSRKAAAVDSLLPFGETMTWPLRCHW